MSKSIEETVRSWVELLADRAAATHDRLAGLRNRCLLWEARFRSTALFKDVEERLTRAWRFLTNPDVSKQEKAIVIAAIAYVVLPLDLIPDCMPVIGLVDDLAAMLVAMAAIDRHAACCSRRPESDNPRTDGSTI